VLGGGGLPRLTRYFNSTIVAEVEGTFVSLANLNQLHHQRVAISLPHLHQELCGAVERDVVFCTTTSRMTTGVGDVGDLLLRHARYFYSLLAQSVEPIMVAPLAALLCSKCV